MEKQADRVTFRDSAGVLPTGRIPFLSIKQHCQSTEMDTVGFTFKVSGLQLCHGCRRQKLTSEQEMNVT